MPQMDLADRVGAFWEAEQSIVGELIQSHIHRGKEPNTYMPNPFTWRLRSFY